MEYYVKELASKRAVLVAEDGYELGEYPSVQVAVATCCEECGMNPIYIERHYSYLETAPNDFEASFLQA